MPPTLQTPIKTVKSRYFSVKFFNLTKQALPIHRVVVGKTVCKKAVERNKLRRQLMAIIKQHKINTSIVVIVHKPITTLSFKGLQEEVKNFFKHNAL